MTSPPDAASLRFSLDEAGDTPVTGTSECVVRQWAWECRVPEATLAVSLKPTGFIGIQWWKLALAGDKDLGPVDLRVGASFIGRVTVPKERRDSLRDVTVRLEPKRGARSHAPGAESRAKLVTLSARARSNGFFHFDAVPPGEYLATASLPGLTGASQSVQIIANVEAELRKPLILEPPKRLDITITPPLDPYAKPWSITLMRETSVQNTFETERQMRMPPTGHLALADLPSGTYQLSVQDFAFNPMTTRTFVVPDVGPVVDIRLDSRKVKGELTMGGKPLQATMWFGGEDGGPSVAATSNAGGLFEVSLPTELGNTINEVTIQAEHPPVKTSVSSVKITQRENGDSVATIDLARTVLLGEVVGEDGSPVSTAVVSVQPANAPPVDVVVRPDGTFELYGLNDGPVFLRAVAEGARQSDAVQVDVKAEAEETEPIRLVVRQSRLLKGHVVSPSGPVPGAVVFVLPAVGRGYTAPRLGTGADGRFEHRLPANASEADVFVVAPGFAIAFMRVPVTAEVVEIPVSQAGGEIQLDFERSPGDLKTNTWPFVRHRGYMRNLGLLLLHAGYPQQKSENWWTVSLANLEPGQYDFCIGAHCSSVSLPPHGRAKARLTLQ